MSATVQSSASADHEAILHAAARQHTGIREDLTPQSVHYNSSGLTRTLSVTTTVVLTDEQTADLNRQLGL